MSDGIPESRNYVHSVCGGVTEVDGGDFKNLAAPVPGMRTTVCAQCGADYPVEQFAWEDTGESIAAYYLRLRPRVTGAARLLASRNFSWLLLGLSLLVGLLVAAATWGALGAWWSIPLGTVAAVVDAVVMLVVWDGVSHRMVSGALGVPDVRCLR